MQTTTGSGVDDGQIHPDNSSLGTNMVHTEAFEDEVQNLMIFQIGIQFNKYWFPILVPIGLVGNTLSFLVMIKPNNRKMSTCIYMAAISINDNVMMLLALRNWLATELKVYKRHPIECKVTSFLVLLVLQNSTFQILAMTVDMYIAIKWPDRASTNSTPKRAKITVVVVFICVVIYNVPHLLASRLIGVQCIGYRAGGTITKVYSWFSFVLNGIIPFNLLIYMNCAIVKTIRQSRKMFSNNVPIPRTKNHVDGQAQFTNAGLAMRQSAMKKAENQLTIMLLLVTTLFLLLLIPTYVRFVYLTFVKPDTPYKYALSTFLFHVTHKLYNTNSGINFVLYCISGQKFRKDLK